MRKLLNTLYITSPDVYLSLSGQAIELKQKDKNKQLIPMHNIEQIITTGYAGVTPALMEKCVSENIDLVFMNPYGKFMARVEGEINGNVLLRKEQYRISDDPTRSLEIAKNMIIGKIYNSRQVILRTLRDHEHRINRPLLEQKADFLNNSLQKCESVKNADSLRGIEGEAASVYFSIFNEMILQQKDVFYFKERSKRPPLDYTNALLSYSYSLCTSMCVSALKTVGLDPYIGFLHTDRPGRASLALDLIEEFRAWFCDRFVLSLINKRVVQPDDFEIRENGAVLLNEKGRRIVLEFWQKRKLEEIKHPFLEEKIEWGLLPYTQALLLSRYIRGDIDAYPPFFWR